jgi:hypothetical protein
VDGMTHTEATGKRVRDYSSVRRVNHGDRGQTIVFHVAVTFLSACVEGVSRIC